jgi:hypothetical protein
VEVLPYPSVLYIEPIFCTTKRSYKNLAHAAAQKLLYAFTMIKDVKPEKVSKKSLKQVA